MSVTIMGRVFWTTYPDLTYSEKSGRKVTISETSAKITMLALADPADDFGENSYNSFETLATKTGLKRRSVIRVIKALIAHRYLSITGLSIYGTNNFKIAMDKLGEMPQKRATTGRPKSSDSVTESSDSVTESSDSVTESSDSTSPESSFIHPDSSSILEAANKEVDFILENEKKARLSWSGREKIMESLWPLADMFVSLTGLKPSKKELMFWMGEWSDWHSWGSSPKDVEEAYAYSRRDNGGFLVASPASLSKTVRAMTARRLEKATQEAIISEIIPDDEGKYVPNPYKKPEILRG